MFADGFFDVVEGEFGQVVEVVSFGPFDSFGPLGVFVGLVFVELAQFVEMGQGQDWGVAFAVDEVFDVAALFRGKVELVAREVELLQNHAGVGLVAGMGGQDGLAEIAGGDVAAAVLVVERQYHLFEIGMVMVSTKGVDGACEQVEAHGAVGMYFLEKFVGRAQNVEVVLK